MSVPTPPPGSEPGSIDEQAAQWLTRRDAGWTAAEAAGFDQWLHAHPLHAAAVGRLERGQALLRRLPTAAPPDLRAEVEALLQPKPRTSRTPFWFAGLAAAAGVALLVAAGLRSPSGEDAAPQSFATASAASRQLELTDGSTVLLGAASQLEVHYSHGERSLLLRSGEASFDVAPDSNRPFVVAAGNITIRAVGTAFKVRHHDARTVEVAVTEGRVQLVPQASAPAVPPEAGLRLGAGESLLWDQQRGLNLARTTAAGAGPAAADPAQTAPRITFWDTPLAQVVAEFNRYSRVQLELGDDTLAGRAIGGSFSGDAAASFAALLAEGGEIRLERLPPDRIILRSAP